MQDETYTATPATRRRGISGRALAATLAAALLLGAGGTAWLGLHFGWLKIENGWFGAPASAPQPVAAAIPAAPVLSAGSESKLAALETRIAQIDVEADAASSKAGRAESLLIAFAARRAIERGQPLGFLETQLRERFGESQPQAVDKVLNASTRPVTLDWLSEQLAILEPDLSQAGPNEGTWDWIGREASQLFIIRRQDSPSPDPVKRLARARQYLAGGRVEAAMDEIQRMPGAAAAKDWLAKAQDYVMTERALDILENAALLQPDAGVPEVTNAPAASVAPAPASNSTPSN